MSRCTPVQTQTTHRALEHRFQFLKTFQHGRLLVLLHRALGSRKR